MVKIHDSIIQHKYNLSLVELKTSSNRSYFAIIMHLKNRLPKSTRRIEPKQSTLLRTKDHRICSIKHIQAYKSMIDKMRIIRG